MPIERATSGVPATTAIWKEGTTYEAGAHACIPYKVNNRWYSHNYICIVGHRADNTNKPPNSEYWQPRP
ncbi:hypothetical protein BD626DRAFT_566060 [Schizophyllum amplum]|uniref:Chitin-binding type-3 domain-containing protein n=1 Tax=Schizophyllum amplum TaxID=97359 RepID=A0A550CQD8_9AGAR|nr:hypothetical protein BD626DRAFT_566060 [Auriculariopsis ampla]